MNKWGMIIAGLALFFGVVACIWNCQLQSQIDKYSNNQQSINEQIRVK